MQPFARARSAVLTAGLLSIPTWHAQAAGPLQRFGLYYSGPPCTEARVDRTYSQFQVNLAPEPTLVRGRLRAGEDGAVFLSGGGDRGVKLLTNASRADWLLTYPLIESEVGVWGHPILNSDCSLDEGSLYVEALFPLVLLTGPIDRRLDLTRRPGEDRLVSAVMRFRRSLGASVGAANAGERGEGGPPLHEEIFSPEASHGVAPWRVRLLGSDEDLPADDSIELLLSGSDGSTGMFGHIAVGAGGRVYNVYPKGSDRGAPEPVPMWDYLFNAQRGQALRRPTWVLRLEGLPPEIVEGFRLELESRIADLQEGRSAYHPTANNCTIVSLNALSRLGFEVAAARYFTRRFPRPAFEHVLRRLPRLIESGRLQARRIELSFVPQVPVRPSEGGAPNRPLRDRSRVAGPQARQSAAVSRDREALEPR